MLVKKICEEERIWEENGGLEERERKGKGKEGIDIFEILLNAKKARMICWNDFIGIDRMPLCMRPTDAILTSARVCCLSVCRDIVAFLRKKLGEVFLPISSLAELIEMNAEVSA